MATPELVAALRAGRPRAPQALRENVRRLAAGGAVAGPSWRARLGWQRAALAGAASLVAVGLGAALVQGLVTGSSPPAQEGVASAPRPLSPTCDSALPERQARTALRGQAWSAANLSAAQGRTRPLPVSGSRLQAYDAYLRLKVRDVEGLSAATSRAMRLARSLGGHVAAVTYDTPGREGNASLELRVPVDRVQEAVARLSELGTILAQGYRIVDLQRTVDRHRARVAQLTERIETLRRRLRTEVLSPAARLRLESQLELAGRQLAQVKRAERTAVRRGRLAEISLALTTRDPGAEKREQPSRIERALDDAGSLLAKEVAWAIYFLVVAGPVLLLVALAYLLARYGRRRADHALLERL